MRVGITTFGCDSGRSGIGRYLICLLEALAGRTGAERFEVIAFADEAERFVPAGLGLDVLRLPRQLRGPLREVLWHQALAPLVAARGYDVLLLPAANRRFAAWVGCPMVGTVHDLASFNVAHKYDPARAFYNTRVLPRAVRRLTRVLTVSESSKRDIVRHIGLPPERIQVTPLGVDVRRFRGVDRDAARRAVRQRWGIDAPYVVYVSRLEHPGKNHVRLIAAHARLAARGFAHHLLLAGSDWTRAEEVHRAARASAVAQRVHLLGFVDDAALPELYAGAELMAFPSLYEGFGLPLLEALAAGTPVVCSDRASMPEVAGDAARLFDPEDVAGIAEAMAAVLGDPEEQRRLVRNGERRMAYFTWERTAELTLDALRAAAGTL